MSDEMQVTTLQPFYVYDDEPVFAVNAGLPADHAREIAANLMYYINHMAAADAFTNKAVESAVIQHLSDMANALMQACGHSGGREGQGNV